MHFPRLLTHIVRTVAGGLATLLAISVLAFAFMNLRSPESVARANLGTEVTNKAVEEWIRIRDLDEPVIERYGAWMGGILRGDLGTSTTTGEPLANDVLPRLANTLILAITALVIAVPPAVAFGARLARRPGTREDAAGVTGTAILQAVPEFVLGLALIMVFAVWLKLLPVTSSGLSGTSGFDHMVTFLLPALTLALSVVPPFVRMARATVREVLQAPYVRAATLRGFRYSRVLWLHTMPNAAGPLLSYLSLNFIQLISGAIIVENLFAFPGLGQALVSAINSGDTAAIQTLTLLMGALFISFNIGCNLLAVYFNPRLKGST